MMMKLKWMVLCALLFPFLVWGGIYFYYMASFGGLLPYIGSPTPQYALCWFIILCVVSFWGLYISLLLTYKYQMTKPWAIALLTISIITCFMAFAFFLFL
jgi:hypothetical protein